MREVWISVRELKVERAFGEKSGLGGAVSSLGVHVRSSFRFPVLLFFLSFFFHTCVLSLYIFLVRSNKTSRSLSTFKSAWASEKLPTPRVGMEPHVLEKNKEHKEEITWKTYDVAEYDRLSASYEDPKTMKWKLIPKPGGQAIKSEDYYTLAACIKQVEEGDAPKDQRLMLM